MDTHTNTTTQSSHGFFGHLRISLVATLLLAIICCGVYPIIVFGISQLIFSSKANGSLIGKDGSSVSHDGDAIGSSLIGQNWSDVKYFHPRPSAAGNGYDATASGGSNLGPTSAKLINGTTKKDDKNNEIVDFDGVHDRIIHYCIDNNITFTSSVPLKQFQDKDGNLNDVALIKAFNADTPLVFTPSREIPADAVTASGSGLDPHISAANADLQVARVAGARKIDANRVNELINQCTDKPSLGIFGDAGVNVLRLNIALDSLK
jgi:K+-transporting ATPase ATPase C chain